MTYKFNHVVGILHTKCACAQQDLWLVDACIGLPSGCALIACKVGPTYARRLHVALSGCARTVTGSQSKGDGGVCAAQLHRLHQARGPRPAGRPGGRAAGVCRQPQAVQRALPQGARAGRHSHGVVCHKLRSVNRHTTRVSQNQLYSAHGALSQHTLTQPKRNLHDRCVWSTSWTCVKVHMLSDH